MLPVADSARSQFVDAGASPESVKATLNSSLTKPLPVKFTASINGKIVGANVLINSTEKSALAASCGRKRPPACTGRTGKKRQFSSEELARLASEEAIQDKIVANHPLENCKFLQYPSPFSLPAIESRALIYNGESFLNDSWLPSQAVAPGVPSLVW